MGKRFLVSLLGSLPNVPTEADSFVCAVAGNFDGLAMAMYSPIKGRGNVSMS